MKIGTISALNLVLYLVLQPMHVTATEIVKSSVGAMDNGRSGIVDDSTENDLGSRSLGFSAGAIGGLGMSYRRFMPNRHGFQIAGAAWGDRERASGNVGVQYMYTVDKNLMGSRFYVLAGTGVYIDGRKYGSYDYDTRTTGPSTWRRSVGLNFGAGMGLEYAPKRGVGVSFEVPLSLKIVKRRNSPNYEFDGIYPIPSVSLFYKF